MTSKYSVPKYDSFFFIWQIFYQKMALLTGLCLLNEKSSIPFSQIVTLSRVWNYWAFRLYYYSNAYYFSTFGDVNLALKWFKKKSNARCLKNVTGLIKFEKVVKLDIFEWFSNTAASGLNNICLWQIMPLESDRHVWITAW